MPANYGQQAKLNRARQTVWDTMPAAATHRSARFFTHSLEGKQDYTPIPVIGGSAANDFDTPELGADMQECSGDIVYPLCINQAGDWLFDVFGAPVTTGTAPNITHTFSSGAATAPRMLAAEVLLSTTRQRRFLGLTPTGLKFDVRKDQSGDSTQRMTVSYMGRSETTNAAALAGVQAERAYAPVSGRTAQVLINGVASAEVTGASFDYRTGVEAVNVLDGVPDTASGIERGADGTCTGSIKVRTNTNTFHTLSDGSAAVNIGFQLGTAAAGLLVTVRASIGKRGQPVSGRGALEAEFPFTGFVGPSTPMVTAALFNALAAGTYT
jgi:hypothetical protein